MLELGRFKRLRDEVRRPIRNRPHRALDVAREAAAGKGKIGPTGRGVGPCYEDKVARRGTRVADLPPTATRRVTLEAIGAQQNFGSSNPHSV